MSALFARPLVRYGAIALAFVAAVVGILLYLHSIREAGRREGESQIIEKINTETTKAIEKARTVKEQADEEVRRTPYSDRVDGLR